MVTAVKGRNRVLISVPDEHPDTLYTRIPPVEAFVDAQSDFIRAKDLEAVVALIMDHYTAQFEVVRHVSFNVVWKRSGGLSHGNRTLGKTTKASGMLRHYAGVDFVIWLAADHARELNGTESPATFWQIEALIYHELMHIKIDDASGAPTLRGHDFEGFAKEVTEYGAWENSAKVMRIAFKQLELDFGE